LPREALGGVGQDLVFKLMENALLEQLGINWKLFLSQAVNFFILFGVLTFFVYKPLLNVIKKRQGIIKEGLEKAEEANVRLKEIDSIAKEKIKEADQKSIGIIKDTQEQAKKMADDLQKQAEEKQKKAMELIKQNALRAQEEANKQILEKAGDLIKKAIVKTVELDPHKIDEALIKKAVSQIKNEN
jgi:F-type H+-transporting ATPase subunit b